MPSFRQPTQGQIDAAVQRMRSPEFAAYFLSRLENPEWIVPLREQGLLTNPPPAVEVEGGGRRHPHYPASRYLARMAKVAPGEVAATFAMISTDNASVLGDMLHAAVDMPGDVGARLVRPISKALDEGSLSPDFGGADELCARLASEGQSKAAMMLAESIFGPKFAAGDNTPVRRNARRYKDLLEKVLPALVAACGEAICGRLCNWLRAAVEAKESAKADTGMDYSYIWRPAIEEHEQNHNYDFAGQLVGLVRQGLELAVKQESVSLTAAIALLEAHPYLVFRRLRVHLINEFAEQDPALVRKTIMDRALFDDYAMKHEYAMLVGRRFAMLKGQEPTEWLDWVAKGPDTSEYPERITNNTGEDVTEEELQRRIRWWKYQRVYWVRDYLAGEWKQFYDEMHAVHGDPELADLNVRHTSGFREHTSPIDLAELKAMGFEQAVERVAAWKPDQSEFDGPTVDGLATTFGQLVSSDPEGLSRMADVLVGRPPIFVRTYITRMAEAIKNGRDVDAAAVLRLCSWVVSQPVGNDGAGSDNTDRLVDRDWLWTREEISRFVQIVCEADAEGGTPRYAMDSLREPMWAIIQHLAEDSAESHVIHDLKAEDPRCFDFLTLGINSPRGKAVEAALAYAHWVAKHIQEKQGKETVVPRGMRSMPEVGVFLEQQISPDRAAFESMSVIGSRMGLLFWIDRAWLESRTGQIFDLRRVEDDPTRAFGWAAWNAFLVWVRPHISYYRMLKPQFAYAARQAATVKVSGDRQTQPMYHLGEHLVLLYGRGQLGLDDDGQLLRRFLSEAASDIRRHSMMFAAQTISGEGDVPSDVIERLMALWDWYWQGKGHTDAAEDPRGILFGLWFATGRFPEQWSLDRLLQFVQVVPIPEPDDSVVEHLARTAHTELGQATRILEQMVRHDTEGWHIHGWVDQAKAILALAMRADPITKALAEGLIDYLGRRGYAEFGALLR